MGARTSPAAALAFSWHSAGSSPTTPRTKAYAARQIARQTSDARSFLRPTSAPDRVFCWCVGMSMCRHRKSRLKGSATTSGPFDHIPDSGENRTPFRTCGGGRSCLDRALLAGNVDRMRALQASMIVKPTPDQAPADLNQMLQLRACQRRRNSDPGSPVQCIGTTIFRYGQGRHAYDDLRRRVVPTPHLQTSLSNRTEREQLTTHPRNATSSSLAGSTESDLVKCSRDGTAGHLLPRYFLP